MTLWEKSHHSCVCCTTMLSCHGHIRNSSVQKESTYCMCNQHVHALCTNTWKWRAIIFMQTSLQRIQVWIGVILFSNFVVFVNDIAEQLLATYKSRHSILKSCTKYMSIHWGYMNTCRSALSSCWFLGYRYYSTRRGHPLTPGHTDWVDRLKYCFL